MAVDGESLTSVMVDGSPRRLMLISWRRLLGAMSSRASVDSAVKRDILQLGALCERQDSEAFLPLRSEEFAPAFPRRMLDMYQLIKDATTQACRHGFADTEGLAFASTVSRFGRWLHIGKDGARFEAWFGVHYELWSRKRETPLWLKFSDRDAVKEKLVDPDYALTLPIGVEYGAVVDSVVEELHQIAEFLSG